MTRTACDTREVWSTLFRWWVVRVFSRNRHVFLRFKEVPQTVFRIPARHEGGTPADVLRYLAHKKHPPPRTLRQDYPGSYGSPRGAVSHVRGTLVHNSASFIASCAAHEGTPSCFLYTGASLIRNRLILGPSLIRNRILLGPALCLGA